MRFRKEDVSSQTACQSFRKEGWVYMCAPVVKSGSGIPSIPCFSSMATTEYCVFQNELATGPMTRRNINHRTLEKCINPPIHPSTHPFIFSSIYLFLHPFVQSTTLLISQMFIEYSLLCRTLVKCYGGYSSKLDMVPTITRFN